MHTTVIHVDGQQVRVHHNSDWSGVAHVYIGDREQIDIPSAVLLALAKRIAIDEVERVVVDALDRFRK